MIHTMIRKTVYFRTQEDFDKFNDIDNKAQWLHGHLNSSNHLNNQITTDEPETLLRKKILERAIQITIKNGWGFYQDSTLLPIKDWIISDSFTVYNSHLQDKMYIPYQVTIFNHDFAKALWGEKYLGYIDEWEYHLQQMVIADDPIKYLGDNLPE